MSDKQTRSKPDEDTEYLVNAVTGEVILVPGKFKHCTDKELAAIKALKELSMELTEANRSDIAHGHLGDIKAIRGHALVRHAAASRIACEKLSKFFNGDIDLSYEELNDLSNMVSGFDFQLILSDVPKDRLEEVQVLLRNKASKEAEALNNPHQWECVFVGLCESLYQCTRCLDTCMESVYGEDRPSYGCDRETVS